MMSEKSRNEWQSREVLDGDSNLYMIGGRLVLNRIFTGQHARRTIKVRFPVQNRQHLRASTFDGSAQNV
jgi:hypothetical protein